MSQTTLTDATLWYNIGPWAEYGLALPNWGDDTHTQNATIAELVTLTGRNLQRIMFDDDARLTTPPSVNTLMRVHRLIVRARNIIGGRAVAPGVPMMESAHANPAPEVFKVHPTPLYLVRNPYLKRWAGFALMALTEMMQHTENVRPIEISTDFGGLIGQYFERIYRNMAVELLRIPKELAETPGFVLADENFAAYNPAEWHTSTEMIDTVAPHVSEPTEDTLKPLTDGIPVTSLGQLPHWPGSNPLPQATNGLAAATLGANALTGTPMAPGATTSTNVSGIAFPAPPRP